MFLKFRKKYFIRGKPLVHENEKVERFVTFYFILFVTLYLSHFICHIILECHKIIKKYKSIYVSKFLEAI